MPFLAWQRATSALWRKAVDEALVALCSKIQVGCWMCRLLMPVLTRHYCKLSQEEVQNERNHADGSLSRIIIASPLALKTLRHIKIWNLSTLMVLCLNKCGVCKRSFAGEVSGIGVYAHAKCYRQMCLSAHDLPGVRKGDVANLKHQEKVSPPFLDHWLWMIGALCQTLARSEPNLIMILFARDLCRC